MSPSNQVPALYRIERKQTLEQRKAEKKKLQAQFEVRTNRLVLGSRSSCELLLDDPVAAEQHCAIQFDGHSFHLVDLDNASGTFLNGVRVEEGAPLADGDRIVVGVASIQLKQKEAGALDLEVREGDFFFTQKKVRQFTSDTDEWVRSEVTFGRMPLLRLLNVVGILAAIGLAGWFWFSSKGQTALSPGPLSDVHAALFSDNPPSDPHLAQFVAIAQEQGCAACHQDFSRPGEASCAQCHGDLVESTLAKQAHPFVGGDNLACYHCHSEHHGAQPEPGLLAPNDIEQRCADCHGDDYSTPEGLAQGLIKAGQDHALAPTTNTPKARVASVGFEAFNHGAHAKIEDCGVCHVRSEADSPWDFERPTYEGCMDCHAEDATVAEAHRPAEEFRWNNLWHGAGEDGGNCKSCHAAPYDAALTSLDQIAPLALAFDLKVRSHQDELHANASPDDCKTCHKSGEILWAGRSLEGKRFRHDQHLSALFPSDEATRRLVNDQCAQCHIDMADSGSLTAAPAPYGGPPIEACASCHIDAGEPGITAAGRAIDEPKSITAANFPHDLHMQVEGGCLACHEFGSDDPEELGFALVSTPQDVATCVRCHSDTQDGLTLAHANIGGGDCSACHQPRGAAFADSPMAAVFYGTDPSAQVPSSFPHFIEAHQAESCSTCHGDPTTQADVHSPLESAATCRECHARERFHWR